MARFGWKQSSDARRRASPRVLDVRETRSERRTARGAGSPQNQQRARDPRPLPLLGLGRLLAARTPASTSLAATYRAGKRADAARPLGLVLKRERAKTREPYDITCQHRA